MFRWHSCAFALQGLWAGHRGGFVGTSVFRGTFVPECSWVVLRVFGPQGRLCWYLCVSLAHLCQSITGHKVATLVAQGRLCWYLCVSLAHLRLCPPGLFVGAQRRLCWYLCVSWHICAGKFQVCAQRFGSQGRLCWYLCVSLAHLCRSYLEIGLKYLGHREDFVDTYV